MVVFGQSGSISSKSGCVRTKVVVFGQKLLYSGKVFILGISYLVSNKVGFFVKSG